MTPSALSHLYVMIVMLCYIPTIMMHKIHFFLHRVKKLSEDIS